MTAPGNGERPSTAKGGGALRVLSKCCHGADLAPVPRNGEGPDFPTLVREVGAFAMCDNVVELGGIEPPSSAESLGLLRAQSVKAFCSAPTFVTDT